MTKEEFISKIKELGIVPTKESLNKLEIYSNILIEVNKNINLTAITNEEEIYLKHFYDSLCIIKIVDLSKPLTLCDMGTGAGFPGIVLKIFFPNIQLTLIDSTKKKTDFLKLLIQVLNLDNVEVHNRRIEEYAELNEEKFDIVTARALAKLNILMELSVKMLKINGFLVAMKSSLDELSEIKNATNVLNMKLIDTKEYQLLNNNYERSLIKISKIGPTNKSYPRNFTQIKKKPL